MCPKDRIARPRPECDTKVPIIGHEWSICMPANTPEPLGLPQNSWETEKRWYDALGVSSRTFRDWLIDYNIPHKRLGSTILVYAPLSYEHAANGLNVHEAHQLQRVASDREWDQLSNRGGQPESSDPDTGESVADEARRRRSR
jgi:hypothetical protein